MRPARRDVLRMAVGAAIGLPILPVALACGGEDLVGSSTGALLRSQARLPDPFTVPLPVPPVLRPVRTDATTDHYEITQRPGRVQVLPGLATEVWGYEGMFPGPTIEARSGRRMVVTHRNQLPVPVSVHLHGGKTPPEHDGYPTDLVLPAAGWNAGHAGHAATGRLSQGARDYVYPLEQRAATLWYHDHRMDFTGPQVYRGLAGFLLLRDEEENALPLPRGEREIPLLICDRAFAEDGSFRYPALDPTLRDRPGVTREFMRGVIGDVVLVNGAPWPLLEVTGTRYRLRFLNASNARRYRLALDPAPGHGPPFVQIGSDGGLLARPVPQDAIEIAPAERFDVVVDFSAYPVGTRVTLLNRFDAGGAGRVMRFHVVRAARDGSAVPSRLADVETLARSAATVTRTFHFFQLDDHSDWVVNGKRFDPERVDAQPRLGATEIWRLQTDLHHPVHVHLARFQVLGRGGRGPGRYDAGWKDTIDLLPGAEAEIIARFTGYRGRYVFHCHNLEHEDMAMMGNFEVV
ncbi:MAG: multicopper oxidase family protein [Chloroflexi bacterium]|nr:MAG: multicopper oxidase family protein [Chloroflexota bacterium]